MLVVLLLVNLEVRPNTTTTTTPTTLTTTGWTSITLTASTTQTALATTATATSETTTTAMATNGTAMKTTTTTTTMTATATTAEKNKTTGVTVSQSTNVKSQKVRNTRTHIKENTGEGCREEDDPKERDRFPRRCRRRLPAPLRPARGPDSPRVYSCPERGGSPAAPRDSVNQRQTNLISIKIYLIQLGRRSSESLLIELPIKSAVFFVWERITFFMNCGRTKAAE